MGSLHKSKARLLLRRSISIIGCPLRRKEVGTLQQRHQVNARNSVELPHGPRAYPKCRICNLAQEAENYHRISPVTGVSADIRTTLSNDFFRARLFSGFFYSWRQTWRSQTATQRYLISRCLFSGHQKNPKSREHGEQSGRPRRGQA